MNRSRVRSTEAIEFARSQRAASNEFTHTVWQWIRNRQLCNQKFRREYPVPPYTADFCCVELRLILEIDGAHHVSEIDKEHDRKRDEFLVGKGYRVVRIAGYDVLREGAETWKMIEAQVRDRMRELGGEQD